MSEAEERKNKRPGEEESIPTASFSGSEDGPGGQIGPYKLLSVLGEGGFGMVYLAEQQKPVKRRVALKIIKPGMDTKQVIARFEAEEQALALLDHPNVAQVYEAGMTKAGRPYFAMECVKGVPITEYCDREKLSIEGRLELFLQVCEGLQHAHQKGVIHRDIKPSNILVFVQEKKVVSKIIDFGVAKAISQPLTERTLFTEQGQLVGTPEYMSPEQAESSQDIDTRTDIYSLGVLLYELLTGVLPFEAETLREGGFEHIKHVIREEEPKTPSTRLSRLSKEESTKLTKRRRTDIGSLRHRLHGDLDWITLKAMEKDRTRRYASAAELAADIRHHLNHEPVLASPPRTLYQIKKFVRRNRALVTGIAAVLIVLIGGIVASTIFAIGQTRARAEAETERNRAMEAERLAEQRRAEAVAVTGFLTNDLLASVDPKKAKGREVTVREVLNAASEKIEGKFEGAPLVEASIRQTLGNTYWSLGEYEAAEPHLERALTIHREQLGEERPDTLESMNNLAGLYLKQGRYDEAEPLFVKALETRRRVLGEAHPDTLESMNNLAVLYEAQGRYDEVEPLYVKVLEMIRRVLGEEHPDTLIFMNNLALLYLAQGRYDEAEPLRVEVLDISRRVLGEEHPHTLTFMQNLAGLYSAQRRYEEAEPLQAKALEGRRRVLGEDHPDTLNTMHYMAGLYENQGRYKEAEALLVKVMETGRRVLGEEHPYTLGSMSSLALLYYKQGRYDEAEPLFVKVVEVSRRVLGEEHPYTLGSMNHLAELIKRLSLQGIEQYRAGAYEQALATLTHVDKLQRTALKNESSPGNVAFIAMGLHQLGRTEEARAALDRLRDLMENARYTNDQEAQAFLREAEQLFAGKESKVYSVWEYIEAGKLKEAWQLVKELRSLPRQKDTELAGRVQSAIKRLARAYYGRGKNRERRGDEYAEVIGDYEAAVRIDSCCVFASNELAWLRATCPVAEFRNGAKAVENATKACELTNWKNAMYVDTLAVAYAEAGDFTAAVKWQEQAIDLLTEEQPAGWRAEFEERLKLYQSAKPYHRDRVAPMFAWWKFDEGTGSTNAVDSSGNRHGGTLVNMNPETCWVAGKHGSALDFDGSDDHIDVGNSATYDSLSIALWVNIDSLPHGYNSLFHNDGWNSGDVHFMILDNGKVRFSINGTHKDQDSNYAFNSGSFGQWHHIAVVYDSTSKTVNFYIDEQLDVQRSYFRAGTVVLGPLQIGGYYGDLTGRNFDGVIDDLRIYSYALSQAEVAAICAGKEPSPVDKAEQAKE